MGRRLHHEVIRPRARQKSRWVLSPGRLWPNTQTPVIITCLLIGLIPRRLRKQREDQCLLELSVEVAALCGGGSDLLWVATFCSAKARVLGQVPWPDGPTFPWVSCHMTAAVSYFSSYLGAASRMVGHSGKDRT